MGKHDRPRNRPGDEERDAQGYEGDQEDEARASDEEESEDQASSEAEDPGEPTSESGLRLGKEVKIGVAVVVGLLIVLGIVLWSKMRRSAADVAPSKEPEKVAAAEKDKVAAPPASADSAFTSSKAKQLTVTDALSGTATAKKAPDGFPAWNAPVPAREKDDERAKPASPNYMSNPAAFTPAQRLAAAPAPSPSPGARPATAWQAEPAGPAVIAGDPRPADPFGRQSTSTRVEVAPPAAAAMPAAPAAEPAPRAASNPLRGADGLTARVDAAAAPRTAEPSSIISVSPARSPAAAQPRAPGSRVYTVQEGDTLYDIARSELGKASRWGEIYDLNRDALGARLDALNPGMQLILPEDRMGRPEVMTQRPGTTFQR